MQGDHVSVVILKLRDDVLKKIFLQTSGTLFIIIDPNVILEETSRSELVVLVDLMNTIFKTSKHNWCASVIQIDSCPLTLFVVPRVELLDNLYTCRQCWVVFDHAGTVGTYCSVNDFWNPNFGQFTILLLAFLTNVINCPVKFDIID